MEPEPREVVTHYVCEMANCLPEDLEDTTLFAETLGLDSLDYVELCMLVEEDLNVVFLVDVIPTDVSLGQYVAFVENQVEACKQRRLDKN